MTDNAQTEKGGQTERWFFRFNLYHRFLHVLIMVSFLGLVITGMPLKFYSAGWAQTLANLLGGIEMAGRLHRVCGAITFLYFILHIIFAVYYLVKVREEPLAQWIVGPNSMVPWIKDVEDVTGHILWFLGLRERPRFDRFTYWEKFDYLAVFWGVGIIGFSGLTLWFPEFFSNFLPGWVFNVSIILHSDEALLAAGFIFTIHFFNTHLRPEKFPLDHVIFTGRMSEEEFRHERPLEYERMLRQGKLESLEATPPTKSSLLWSNIVGFIAYGIGLIMIILILYSTIQQLH
jgi:thiosulfate reductase cytochrome b subunit